MRILKLMFALVVAFSIFGIKKADALTTKQAVTDGQLLIFSHLAYTNLEPHIGKPMTSVVCSNDFKTTAFYKEFKPRNTCTGLNKYLDGWTPILSIDDNAGTKNDFFGKVAQNLRGTATGFGVNVFENKKKNLVVIAFRGSDEWSTDWKRVNPTIHRNSYDAYYTQNELDGITRQVRWAEIVTANTLLSRPKAKIYFTGHSLGGFLAQYMTIESQENLLHKQLAVPYFPRGFSKTDKENWQNTVNSFKKRLVKEVPSYSRRIDGLSTFNAPGIFIDSKTYNKYKYEYEEANHFYIKGDVVSSFNDHLGYKKTRVPDLNDGTNAHAIKKFYWSMVP